MNCDDSIVQLIDSLIIIEKKQNCNIETCKQELGMNEYLYNTIPIMFICKSSCEYFVCTGIFKDSLTDSFKCLETPIFRLAKFDKEKKKVILELLQPQTINGEISPFSFESGICKFFSNSSINKFIRTGLCIEVSLNCFCGLECLQPICAKHGIIKETKSNPNVINVVTSEYISFSDGIKKVYLDSDGVEGFNVIPNPLTISYSNLFINGMLQPPSSYIIVTGKLTLNTQDVPIPGTCILLQLIKIIK